MDRQLRLGPYARDRARRLARYAAIAGDGVFVLWILRNGIDEGFRGTPPEIASYVALILLLALNATLVYRAR
jgi:hypothetical protein